MPEYTFYIDAWLVRLGANFLFEYLLLWATAEVTRTPTRARKLAAGALLGTIHYGLYLLASLGIIPFYGMLRFLPTIIAVSILMVTAAFYPIPLIRLARVLGYFYLIGFIAAGAGMAGAFLLGSPDAPAYTLGMLIAAGAILITAELGWGIVHQRIVQTVYQIPVRIECFGRSAAVQALVDTGNNLKDPFSRQPVMIVEQRAISSLIPAALADAVQSLENGDISGVDNLLGSSEWAARLRLIPFSSIGKEHGILLGFRPDAVHIHDRKNGPTAQPIVAIHPRTLDPEGRYDALIPPSLLEQAVEEPIIVPKAKGGQQHAPSSHHKA